MVLRAIAVICRYATLANVLASARDVPAVFEIGVAGGVERGGGADTAGESRDHIIVELIETDPSPLVQLVGGELDVLLVVIGQVAAVEEEQQFVAVTVVGCPIDRYHPTWFAVEAEFFNDFAVAGGSGGFTTLDISAGDVPGVFVDRMDQKDSAGGIKKQCPSCDTGCGEGSDRVGHKPSVRWLLLQ